MWSFSRTSSPLTPVGTVGRSQVGIKCTILCLALVLQLFAAKACIQLPERLVLSLLVHLSQS